jgi:hypothetical protein
MGDIIPGGARTWICLIEDFDNGIFVLRDIGLLEVDLVGLVWGADGTLNLIPESRGQMAVALDTGGAGVFREYKKAVVHIVICSGALGEAGKINGGTTDSIDEHGTTMIACVIV